MTMDKADRMNVPEPALAALQNVKGGASPGKSDPPNVKKKKKRKKSKEDSSDTTPANEVKQAPKKGGADGAHPKAWGKHYITNHDGTEICFEFAKGDASQCPEPCKEKRAYVCQWCLGSYTNSDCPNRKKEAKGGKGAGKKN